MKTSKKRAAPEELVPETMEVPEYLRPKPTDTEEQKASKRRRLRAMKANHRSARSEIEQNQRQSSWQEFQAGKHKIAKKKIVPGVRLAPSIFQSPDTIDGKVGVVGSGKGMTEAAGVATDVSIAAADDDDD
jgi:survival-of-motor-neuron-related-splicing factor 30